MILSVVIITHNEEANIGRTLASVQPLVADGKGEIIVVDSGSTDRTIEIAKSFGAKVFIEEWKGYAAQKNSAIDKATGEWIGVWMRMKRRAEILLPKSRPRSDQFGQPIGPFPRLVSRWSKHRWIEKSDKSRGPLAGYWISRKNDFLGRWIKHGGFWSDPSCVCFVTAPRASRSDWFTRTQS